MNIRINVMVKYLKPRARTYDKAIFNEWENGVITTDECIREFRKNNNITERMPIMESDFVEWLNTLGYWRHDNGKKKADK